MPTYSLLEHLLFPPTFLNRGKLARSVEGKTVLITGASSGIGEQLVYLLSDTKAHLILVARRGDKLQAIKNALAEREARISVYAADLRNETEMEALLDELRRLPDGVDIVVSNAGHSIRRPIRESLDRYHDFTRTMAINYFAPVRLLLSLVPMLESKRGHVVNVSTANALLLPVPNWAAYQASKSAFDTWFRAAAPEWNRAGMSATSIYPPLVRTPMIAPTAAYRKAPAMSPMHVAKWIGKSIYTRRRTFRPWWLPFGQIGSVLFRRGWEASIASLGKKERNGHDRG
ncbi:SDR family NAD(P)-dependent oxidoreductase [Paenibacillus sp.]|uniref:SDR family NAD(P)-dependent oxidoreductase n=1 Tax=Paenibacillus sp. TaxID=58172 RepID=UPI002810FCAA|nr:SDR family NAD(P)-dependent oxidoreductase [Paenibacillus sp.]